MMTLGLGFALGLGLLDFLTGFELSFAFFYLLPVSFVAWFAGRGGGVLLSLFSALIWHLANQLAGQRFSSPLISYWNAFTRLGFFLVVTLLLSDLKRVLERERAMSRTDSLTGVANRRAFYDCVAAEIQRACRYGQPLAVAYLDVDDFKAVNDQFGHNAGDRLLQEIARTMAAHARGPDVVARLGGDEFALLLLGADEEAARRVLDRLHAELAAAMARHRWPVTFSIGVMIFPLPPPDIQMVIKLADELMYAVKNHGKNAIRYEVYSGQVEAMSR